MKDMSVEELLNIVSKGDKVWTYAARDGAGNIIGEVKEYREAKTELLRRFEALENFISDIGVERDNALVAYESMKCCGNCAAFDGTTICFLKDDIMYCNKYCPQWQSDGLSREEREGK